MSRIWSAVFVIGAVLLLVGAAVFVTGWQFAPYVYVVGATMVALSQLNAPFESDSIVARRLHRQQIFGAICLVVAGVLMFFTHHNEWIACMTVGAVFELYTSFRLPQVMSK